MNQNICILRFKSNGRDARSYYYYFFFNLVKMFKYHTNSNKYLRNISDFLNPGTIGGIYI